MIKIDKILFPSDLTVYSVAGLDYALTMSKMYDAKLYILHILDTTAFEDITGNIPEMDELYLSLEANKRFEMNRYIRENLKNNSNVFQTLRFGKVDEEIIKFAEQENVNLIIMEENGVHSKTGLYITGIIEKVLTGTDIPVLKTRGPGVETEMQFQSNADRNYQLNTFGMALFN